MCNMTKAVPQLLPPLVLSYLVISSNSSSPFQSLVLDNSLLLFDYDKLIGGTWCMWNCEWLDVGPMVIPKGKSGLYHLIMPYKNCYIIYVFSGKIDHGEMVAYRVVLLWLYCLGFQYNLPVFHRMLSSFCFLMLWGGIEIYRTIKQLVSWIISRFAKINVGLSKTNRSIPHSYPSLFHHIL
jgi:hypothetical protein